jgi:hypothetical protein
MRYNFFAKYSNTSQPKFLGVGALGQCLPEEQTYDMEKPVRF